jgi:hypothetical protein
MELTELKKQIGDTVCLMGGIELKHLEFCTPQQVEDLTKRTIAAGKPGGRFVIMPTAAPIAIELGKSTEENYLRFIETALAEGKY